MTLEFEIDDQDWLVGVDKIPSNHVGGAISPLVVLNHWTAGGSGRLSVDVLDRLGLSAHLVIERDGTIYQTAPFTRRCVHAGRSTWRGRPWVNGFSIGIEWANYGPVVRQADGSLRNVYGGRYSGPVLQGIHANGSRQFTLWEPFTDIQRDVGLALHRAFKERYPSIVDVVGHHEVSPGRKIDISPDPALDLWKGVFEDRIRDRDVPAVQPSDPAVMEEEPVNLAAVQQALNMAGHRPRLKVDGLLGPLTRNAVHLFQQRAGLRVDGIAGPKTRAALGL